MLSDFWDMEVIALPPKHPFVWALACCFDCVLCVLYSKHPPRRIIVQCGGHDCRCMRSGMALYIVHRHTRACTGCCSGGGGWGWHNTSLCCCLQLAAPIGLSPLTAALHLKPLPPQAAAPIGLSPPCAPAPPSFPSGGSANGAPGLSLFHCSVPRLHGGGQTPSPLARCVQADNPTPAVGDPSPTAAFFWGGGGQTGPSMHQRMGGRGGGG